MELGIWKGIVVRHEVIESGTDYVSVWFRVPEQKDEQIEGKIWLSNKAAKMARRALKAIGFDLDTRSVYELNKNKTELAGNEAELDIDEETYQGVASIKVKWINPIPKPVTEQKAKGIDAMLRAAKSAKEEESEEEPQETPKTTRRKKSDAEKLREIEALRPAGPLPEPDPNFEPPF